MTELPVTDERLRYVLDHLWTRGVVELGLLGATKEQAFTRFQRYVRDGYRSAVLEADGVPVIAVGIASDEGGAFTWFQATDQFDRHARFITRAVRRAAKDYPGESLVIYSVCVHPDTARWFRVLGFVPTDYAQTLPTGATLRKFERV